MENATYKVTTTDGLSRTLEFAEHHTETDCGNYIVIVNTDVKEVMAYVNMRYQNYVFETFCKNYVKQYYGKNLLTYLRIS